MLRDEPISEKVDLYGFGIMLWEMYTGKLPWSDKNVGSIMPRPHAYLFLISADQRCVHVSKGVMRLGKCAWRRFPGLRPV